MTMTFELDLDTAEISQDARYLGQRVLIQKLSLEHTETQTHIGPIALPEPLIWSVV